MGTDVIPIANHSISFEKRSYSDIAQEIISKLDNEKNNIFRLFRQNEFCIDSITKAEWKYYEFEDQDELYKKLEFYIDTVDLFDIDKNMIIFTCQAYRYSDWMSMDDDQREKHKALMFYLTKLFGGDRIIYLADNSHPLEHFLYDQLTFVEIEKNLMKEFGLPKDTYQEALENYFDSYFVDKI